MSWQRILGHEQVVAAFQRASQKGRLAHAYLFCGLAGLGKKLFARELAKALLCENSSPDKLEACDNCSSCALVEAETHPDFFAVGRPEGSNELPIETMRELCRSFSLKSARGKGKVAILDDADDLNDASANCFLKTLEEPPPRSVFILIGASPDRQLPTVISRCQVVRFAPLPDALVLSLLRQQTPKGPVPLEQLVRLSGGSPGQAWALADPALWNLRRRFLEGFCQARPDSVALARAFMEFAEEGGKDSASQRRRACLFLKLLIAFLSDALVLSLGGQAKITSPEDAALLDLLASRYSPDTILALLERCLEAEFHIDRYVQLVLAIEGLVDALGQRLVS